MAMKRRLLAAAAAFSLSVFPAFTACGRQDTFPEQEGTPDNDGLGNDDPNNPTMNRNILVTVGAAVFPATLEDNPTAREFAARLPLTLRMDEMNGNEKYAYLDSDLPSAASRPGTIHAGDLMLYGTNCVVLFYTSFASSYSYIRIGRVNDPSELPDALGAGDVTVVFRR